MNTIKATMILGGFAVAALSGAQTLAQGTEVMLRFKDPVSSKTAKAGDVIHFVVSRDVSANGMKVIAAGTPIVGTIEKVDKRDHFGKNGRIRITISPVMVKGKRVVLEPRDKGKPFQGSKTDHAAAAAGAGGLILGPLGLAAGYFVVGKSVNVHPGDVLRTEVTQSVSWK